MPRTPLWTPTPDRVATTGMDTFRRRVAATRPELVDSVALHRWSIEHQGEFHEALWDFAGVIGESGSVAFDAGDGSVRGGRFFPQSHVCMAENLLAHRDGANDPSPAKAAWLIDGLVRHHLLPPGTVLPPDLAAQTFRSDLYHQEIGRAHV